MGRIGERLDIDFVVSTGDNFYDNGLTGYDDSAFEDSFTNIYTANSLQKPWYSGKFPHLSILFPSSTILIPILKLVFLLIFSDFSLLLALVVY